MSTAVSVYRQPGFLAFLIARVLAMLAIQIQAVVVAWQVYEMTEDPLSLAYVGLAQFLPMLFLLLPAGDLIDRFNRKSILFISWLVEAVCAAGLIWLSWLHASPWAFYGLLVLFGCARAFTGPALQSLLPQIVPREQLAAAIAANSMLMRSAAILGPVAGGILYAVGGGELTYAFCSVGFALACLLLLRVPVAYAEPMAAVSGSSWARFTAGIGFIRSRPIILGTISLDLFAVLLGGVIALLPVYAKDVLNVGSDGLGLLRSAMAIGEVAMGIFLSIKPFDRRVGLTMFAAVAVFGLANLVFALSSWYWLSFAALLIAGAADMVSVYIRSTLIQFSTPDAMRGRVNAVNMLFIGSSNELGEFRAGVSAAAFGVVGAAVTGSLCTLGVVAAWMKLFKPLCALNHFADASPDTKSVSG